MTKETQRILMGNEAIGRGLVEAGVSLAASYPGTPASEILQAVVAFAKETGVALHAEWSVNEKVAYETALANAMAGRRSAVAMKQVGLNVASDPFMRSAYLGVKGGLIVISADDPGPHSSQTEQDSRFFAMFAKLPVLDPASPREAKEMVRTGLRAFGAIRAAGDAAAHHPGLPRPAKHPPGRPGEAGAPGPFREERPALVRHPPVPAGAAPGTQRARSIKSPPSWSFIRRSPRATAPIPGPASSPRGWPSPTPGTCWTSWVCWARIDFYQVTMPYPLNRDFVREVNRIYHKILVLEETYPVIELQLANGQIQGRRSRAVPNEGRADSGRPPPHPGEISRSAGSRPRPPAPRAMPPVPPCAPVAPTAPPFTPSARPSRRASFPATSAATPWG